MSSAVERNPYQIELTDLMLFSREMIPIYIVRSPLLLLLILHSYTDHLSNAKPNGVIPPFEHDPPDINIGFNKRTPPLHPEQSTPLNAHNVPPLIFL